MKRRSLLRSIPAFALFGTGGLGQPLGDVVYELRMYTIYPGKLNDVLNRFRFHTLNLFERHGMKNVAYRSVLDPIGNQPSLVYLLAHGSRAAASVSWESFEADPRWHKVRGASEANGPLISNTQSIFLKLTEFSPILKS